MTPSFDALSDVHARLQRAFEKHRFALLDGDLETGFDLLRRYRAALLGHMRDEEELLLPLYRAEPAPAQGAPELFVHEHRHMLDTLQRIGETLRAAIAAGGDERRRLVLAALDEEARLLAFTEHHERREELHLFPVLDRIVPDPERRRLIELCSRRGDELG